jgi:hypothetical protein
MKQINVYFEDIDYDKLKKLKDSKKLSWRKFILQLLPKEDEDASN